MRLFGRAHGCRGATLEHDELLLHLHEPTQGLTPVKGSSVRAPMYDARRVRPIRVPSFLSNFLRISTTAWLITTKDCSSNSDQWKETSDCWLATELVPRARPMR